MKENNKADLISKEQWLEAVNHKPYTQDIYNRYYDLYFTILYREDNDMPIPEEWIKEFDEHEVDLRVFDVLSIAPPGKEWKMMVRFIKKAIEEKGITQAQLGEKIGMAQPNISRFFSMTHCPSLDLFFRICRVLELDIFFQSVKPYELNAFDLMDQALDEVRRDTD